MPLWEQGTRALARRMPKVITPTTHAAADYAVAGIFFLGAPALEAQPARRRGLVAVRRREVTNALLTDYPGGAVAAIELPNPRQPRREHRRHYRIHSNADGVFRRARSPLFSVQALAETVISGMTDYGYYEGEE